MQSLMTSWNKERIHLSAKFPPSVWWTPDCEQWLVKRISVSICLDHPENSTKTHHSSYVSFGSEKFFPSIYW